MTPMWKDGILTLLRVAKRGTEMALDEDEVDVVASLIVTALAAQVVS